MLIDENTSALSLDPAILAKECGVGQQDLGVFDIRMEPGFGNGKDVRRLLINHALKFSFLAKNCTQIG